MWKKAPPPLGDFEQLVLMGVLRLGDTAYGAAIRQEIHARSGRDVSISAVYTTLDRLEAKGSSIPGSARRPRSAAVAAAGSTPCVRPAPPPSSRRIAPSRPWPPGSKPGWRRNEPDDTRLDRLAADAPPRRSLARSRHRRPGRGVRGPRRRRARRGPALAALAGDPQPRLATARSPIGAPVAAPGEASDAADSRRRRPLRPARPGPDARLRPRRHRRPRPRHRRDHGDVQHPQHGAAAPAAVRRAGAARAAVPRAATGDVPGHPALLALTGQLLRLAARGEGVRGDGDVSHPLLHPDGERHAALGRRGDGRRGLLRHRARATGAGPRAPPGRGSTGRERRRRQRRLLADAPRRPGRRGRTDAHPGRPGVRDRRGDAAVVLQRVVERHRARSVAAARPHRRAARQPREPQPAGGRAAATRRRRAAGDLRAGRHRHAAGSGLSRGQRRLGRDRGAAPGGDRRRHPHDPRDAARPPSRWCC